MSAPTSGTPHRLNLSTARRLDKNVGQSLKALAVGRTYTENDAKSQKMKKGKHTWDGVAKLLPVTPDVSRPHPGEASDAWEGGARQDEWSLTTNLYESAGDGEQIQPINHRLTNLKIHSVIRSDLCVAKASVNPYRLWRL